MERGTANERFKARAGRHFWAAGVIAVAAHAAILLFVPPIQLQGSSSRMVVYVGPWSPPTALGDMPPAYVAFDRTLEPVQLRNRTAVNQRLPRIYPWLMWHHREPSSALVEVAVSRTGQVRRATLLRHVDNGAEAALLGVARLVRFELDGLPDSVAGFVATVEIGVGEP